MRRCAPDLLLAVCFSSCSASACSRCCCAEHSKLLQQHCWPQALVQAIASWCEPDITARIRAVAAHSDQMPVLHVRC